MVFTGLPPTIDEVNDFVNDPDPLAHERRVDEQLFQMPDALFLADFGNRRERAVDGGHLDERTGDSRFGDRQFIPAVGHEGIVIAPMGLGAQAEFGERSGLAVEGGAEDHCRHSLEALEQEIDRSSDFVAGATHICDRLFQDMLRNGQHVLGVKNVIGRFDREYGIELLQWSAFWVRGEQWHCQPRVERIEHVMLNDDQ